MRRISLLVVAAAALLACIGSPALATIETIKGSLGCFVGCARNVVQNIVQGDEHHFEVVGKFVDLSTAVEISGSGVTVSYGNRKVGSGSSIFVKFVVGVNAAPGERTVKMRYAIETSGPDTFTVRVVRKGTISQIQYRRTLRPAGGPAVKPAPTTVLVPATELVPATDLPLNERVVLIVTGTRLENVQVRPEITYPNVRVLPGATATSCAVEIEFTSAGQGPFAVFDAALSERDMRSSLNSRFSYTSTSRPIRYGGLQTTTGSTVVSPNIGGPSVGSPGTFVDVAPRANMLNIFRRSSNFAPVNRNGLTMLRLEDHWCNGMPLNTNNAKIISIPNLTWGVSNVGTSDINTAFAAQLISGTGVLATETVPGLNPGETRDFTFQRQTSTVRVRRFSDLQGCFASPNDAGSFFEDPPFTVKVNTNGALTEATANQGNNSRNY